MDAPGATWDNVMADTKGYAWRISCSAWSPTLPLIVPALFLVGFGSGPPWIVGALSFDLYLDVEVVGLTLFIVIASRSICGSAIG